MTVEEDRADLIQETSVATGSPGRERKRLAGIVQIHRYRFCYLAVVAGVPALLFLVPAIFWTSIFGHRVPIGGDVPNVLMLDPASYLKHDGLRIDGNGLSGYNVSFLSYDSIAIVALVARTIGINPVVLISGLVLAGTYTAVRLLAQTLGKPESRTYDDLLPAAYAGLVATLAPLIAQTFWTDWLPRLYLLPVAPSIAYLLIRYVQTGRRRYLGLLAVVVFFASSAVADLPGALPAALFVLAIVAIAVFIDRGIPLRTALSRLAIALVAVAAFNGFWLTPFLGSAVLGQSQVAYASTSLARVGALQASQSLARLQDLRYSLSLQVPKQLMSAYGWPQLDPSSSTERLWVLGLIPVMLASVAVVATLSLSLSGFQRVVEKRLAAVVVLDLILLSFLTLKVPGSLWLFDWLTVHLPGWVSVRNFYETFAIPYVLGIALAAGLGLCVLSTRWPRSMRVLVVIGCATLVVTSVPLISGRYFELPYYAGSPGTRTLSGLPKGYTDVTRSLNSTNAAAGVVTLPLSTTTWSYLKGTAPDGTNSTYIGVSPLLFSKGISDYNGVDAFDTLSDPNVHGAVQIDVSSGQTRLFSNLIRALGVNWIISEQLDSSAVGLSQALMNPNPTTSNAFDARLIRDLNGQRVAQSGRYSLWRIEDPVPFLAIEDRSPFITAKFALQLAATDPKATFNLPCAAVGNVQRRGPDVMEFRVLSGRALSRCLLLLHAPGGSEWHLTAQAAGRHLALRATDADGQTAMRLPILPDRTRVTVSVVNAGQSPLVIGEVLTLLSITCAFVFVAAKWRLRQSRTRSTS